MPTQYNSPIYVDNAPKIDAASIQTLRAKGALIFGKSPLKTSGFFQQEASLIVKIGKFLANQIATSKTTTTEFAATVVGPSHKGPKTTNAHNPTRTPGGSSSGSGAAVGDMQVPIGLGTQTVGSTVRPGSFNGIYAMKPNWNSISREGQKLYSLIFDTLGLYARSVEDLKLLLDAFQVVDDGPEEPFTLKGAKFALLTLPTPEWPEPGPGTAATLKKGTELLRAHGAEVEEITLPDEFRPMYKYHLQVLSGDGRVAFLADYHGAKDKMHESLVDHVENKDKHTRQDQLKAFDELAAMRPKIDALIQSMLLSLPQVCWTKRLSDSRTQVVQRSAGLGQQYIHLSSIYPDSKGRTGYLLV
ncbi:hypothetical protein PMIN06_006516 [Paraphaeosphaeria minitans]